MTNDERRGVISAGLGALEARIREACTRAGRSPADVLLVAVSKTFPASDVALAIEAGVADVGENRVQEARDKRSNVALAARWHLIGHLQSNKAKDAVRLFDVIQTVDSVELAEKVARSADLFGKRQEILLQVNVGGETQKSGAEPSALAALARRTAALSSLQVTGLMAIPPAGDNEEMRSYFRQLRALRDDLGLTHLSMGMSGDFEIAIEEGATIIRVGQAIFGSRG